MKLSFDKIKKAALIVPMFTGILFSSFANRNNTISFGNELKVATTKTKSRHNCLNKTPAGDLIATNNK